MKRFLISFLIILGILFSLDYFYYYTGTLYLPHKGPPQCVSQIKGKDLFLDLQYGLEQTSLRGVNLGSAKPGAFPIDGAITEEEYLRWFQQIQDLGANVIRVYRRECPAFYNAFYAYNSGSAAPLYLIQGIPVDDYLMHSAYSVFDPEFYKPFMSDCRSVVDVIHGRFKRSGEPHFWPGVYNNDVSPWVYGYILGEAWDGDQVVFANDCLPPIPQFNGTYLKTVDADNFEIFLAQIGDHLISYEAKKYGDQRVLAFANSEETCPLNFSEKNQVINKKVGKIDIEHIKATESFKGGMFASYQVYPYSPQYIVYEDGGENIRDSFLDLIKALNEYHSVPVVITEFGIPTSRGMASYEDNQSLGRNQGNMDEVSQGEALVSLCRDIERANCAGGIVFTWQDEWFRSSWNTISTVNQENCIYWSDLQTNAQHFGLLSFDPGRQKRNCVIDGNPDEWTSAQVVLQNEDLRLSMQYDLEGIYFLIQKEDILTDRDSIFIPIDLTPKSGSAKADNLNISMTEPADFVVQIRGSKHSRIWIQKRYDPLPILYNSLLTPKNNPFAHIPNKNSPIFEKIQLPLNERKFYYLNAQIPFKSFDPRDGVLYSMQTQKYETGLLHYGNGDPSSPEYDSLTDFCFGEDCAEVRIPWQLINFSDPVEMLIHDDYYHVYGVEPLKVNHMMVGVGSNEETIKMVKVSLEPLSKQPIYHERLKRSYYILQDYWKSSP